MVDYTTTTTQEDMRFKGSGTSLALNSSKDSELVTHFLKTNEEIAAQSSLSLTAKINASKGMSGSPLKLQ